jgi:hypothetical protein
MRKGFTSQVMGQTGQSPPMIPKKVRGRIGELNFSSCLQQLKQLVNSIAFLTKLFEFKTLLTKLKSLAAISSGRCA